MHEEDSDEENTSDSYESKEIGDSSALNSNSFGANDDDEEYLNEEPLTKDNHIDKPKDNRYEESSVKRQDNDLQLQSLTKTNNPLLNMNTYQYLAQLWQNLQTYTTTTTTTKQPLTVLHRYHHQEPKTKEDILRVNNNRRILKNSPQVYTDTITTFRPRTLYKTTAIPINNTTTTTTTTPLPSTSTFIKTLRKQFQYYVKLLQNTPPKQQQQQHKPTDSNSLNRYSRSSSPKTTTTTTRSLSKPYYNSHTILPSKPYSNSLNNPAASKQHLYNPNKLNLHNSHNNGDDNTNNNNNNEDDNDDDDEENADEEDEDSGDDNDESNETIEKQKRKLNQVTPLSTNMPQQLQASPPTNPTISQPKKTTTNLDIASGSTGTTQMPPIPAQQHYGIRSVGNPTLFESYVKKLPSLNVAATTTETSYVLRTTEDVGENSSIKTASTSSLEHEGEQYLKRMPTVSTHASSSSSSSSKNSIKHFKSTTAPSSSGAGVSSISTYNKFMPQVLKIIQETDKDTETDARQTSGAGNAASYVTNYIGDNTNRLSSIVQQHSTTHQQQQQQKQQKSFTKSSLLSSSASTLSSLNNRQQHQHQNQQKPQQQQQSVVVAYSSSSTTTTTTRRPKIKTQKLIRRLRTQIK